MRCAAPLWERPGLRAVAGDTLRPGGFALTDRAAEAMGVLPGWRVLDVGCGLGATVARLRARYGAKAYGVEPSAAQVERGAIRSGVIRAGGDCLPFGDGTFSAVFCECVLSLLPDPRAGLREFHRVLLPGGFLALSDLCARDDGGSRGDSCADRAVPLESTRAMVEKSGFETVLVEDHTRLLTDLAARLAFAGETGGRTGRGGLGYYLMIARKRGWTHA
ncbi:MAG: methyltransferase domain-containing protein [Desulfovibrionaceae bacterium]|nr:methyltransferase domain-containing protein [Desulfovibrionaceae bacterium]